MEPLTRLMTRFRSGLLLAMVSLAALAVYLLASQATLRAGFPLDDAWIHQTYARNLALRGEFAFIPGQPSAGSTAPLWSFLLSLGYLLGLAPLVWTFFLGWVSLTCVAWMGNRIGFHLSQPGGSRLPWIGILLAGEWHLVWAAGSGMETALYAFISLLIFWLLTRDRIPTFFAGLVCGVCTWIRPDGLTLIGPVIFTVFLTCSSWRDRMLGSFQALVGLLIGLVPYLTFNHALGGAWWPNTFFAKQAEYAIRLQEPFFTRFFRLLSLPWIGVGVLLIPGFFYILWQAWRKRQWAAIAAAAWWLGYTLIYALFLPVDFQHGRYLIPAMPVFFVLGAAGTFQLLQKLTTTPRWRLVRFASLATLILVWLVFYARGALAYGEDVAIIETEMVDTGQWIVKHTPPDALIAAHDIGAIGYFGQRKMLDLAGLISPEVIPFIRDEARLSSYLDQRGASYLVTFPGWYPQLVKRGQAVFQTGA